MYSTFSDVLEYLPEETTNSPSKNKLLKQIDSYLKEFDLHIKDNLCVSLSGGVDSMIIVYCLNYLKSKYHSLKI